MRGNDRRRALEADERTYLARRDPELLGEVRKPAQPWRQLGVEVLLQRDGLPQARVEVEGVGFPYAIEEGLDLGWGSALSPQRLDAAESVTGVWGGTVGEWREESRDAF